MPILKLKKDNPEKELEFELKYQRSLTLKERFELIEEHSKWMLKCLVDSGQKKPFEIIKRR